MLDQVLVLEYYNLSLIFQGALKFIGEAFHIFDDVIGNVRWPVEFRFFPFQFYNDDVTMKMF